MPAGSGALLLVVVGQVVVLFVIKLNQQALERWFNMDEHASSGTLLWSISRFLACLLYMLVLLAQIVMVKLNVGSRARATTNFF